jgi:hypothetical protein
MRWKESMSEESNNARLRAKNALIQYGIELNKAGYNDRCIQDSIMVLSLDVVLKRWNYDHISRKTIYQDHNA